MNKIGYETEVVSCLEARHGEVNKVHSTKEKPTFEKTQEKGSKV